MSNIDLPSPPASSADRSMAASISTSVRVNDSAVTVVHDCRMTLLDLLRDELTLTGTKKGCDHGQCGACTVLIDGQRVLSCLTLAATVAGRSVQTIEGIGDPDHPHPLQAAFIEHDAFQCGFCTPGQIMSAIALLGQRRPLTKEMIKEQMSGKRRKTIKLSVLTAHKILPLGIDWYFHHVSC